VQTPGRLQALLGEPTPFDALDVAQLRRRRSWKWSAYPPDVLPAFVAEMDLPLSPVITATLQEAIALGDAGYAREDLLPAAFARFAAQQWSWEVDPQRVVLAPDTMSGVARALEILTAPGDGVVFTPPVYGPFARTIERLGRRPVVAPMSPAEGSWRLDLDAIEAALASGGRAILLCNPHNPTGALPSAAQLRALLNLAARYEAGIVSDEVHGPLSLPGQQFTPLLSLGPARAITVFSASKAWNVPGLKCALAIGGDPQISRALNALPNELRHPSHLGVLAAAAAFDGAAAGDGWLGEVTRHLAVQHERACTLLAELLPSVVPAQAAAGYLLWLDCRALGLGDDPAAVFLASGRVALAPGLEFGPQGAGFARLNVGTSGPLLLEAISRMQTALAASG
jgi:cystathionine beta-lyase